MTVKIKTPKKKKQPYCCYLRELMRDPPDKTTEKAPLSLQNLSDSCAVYLARATARSSADSNTSFFTSPFVAIDTLVLLLLTLQQWLNLLSLTKERDKPLSLSVEALTSKGLCDALDEIMGTWNNRTEVVEMESLVWRVKGRAIHFL